MIHLTQADRNIIDLSVSDKFSEEYYKKGAFPNEWSPYKYIIETEINNGQWYDNLLNTIPHNGIVVDIGMNVGLFVAYLGGKRKYYGIEPCDYHIEVAKDLFEKLNYDVTVWEGVIYNKDGTTALWEAPENTTSNRVGDDAPKKVECRTLKTFFEENGIDVVDFLKIDCEGSEKQIILEDETIGEALVKCNAIFIETHCGDAYMTLEERDSLVEKIKSFGFNCREAQRSGSYYFTR